MKTAIVTMDNLNNRYSFLLDLKARLAEETEIRTFSCSNNTNLYSELLAYSPDILISVNLAGFQMSTLSGGISYNLIHAKQIHILDASALSNDTLSVLSKPLSLTMHFLCLSTSDKDKLLEINPDIPFINVLANPPEEIIRLIRSFK